MGTRSAGRNKNHTGIIILLILLAAAGICALFIFLGKEKGKRTAHISLDDATAIFLDIYREEYDSIFDNAVLGKLKYLHETYGITADLYIFGMLDEFGVWDMPVRYREEFAANAEWLKIGYHSIAEENPALDGRSFEEFREEYAKIDSAIRRFAGGESVAHVLRLHYWYATEEMVAYLKEQGITGLLCSDRGEPSYDLTEKQVKKLYRSRDGRLEEKGMTYYVTDIRLEDVRDIEAALEEHRKDRIIVIFTHAWCFAENYDKLEAAIQWLVQEGYEFSSLESLPK